MKSRVPNLHRVSVTWLKMGHQDSNSPGIVPVWHIPAPGVRASVYVCVCVCGYVLYINTGYGLSQWEMTLHCNDASHCMSTYPECAAQYWYDASTSLQPSCSKTGMRLFYTVQRCSYLRPPYLTTLQTLWFSYWAVQTLRGLVLDLWQSHPERYLVEW